MSKKQTAFRFGSKQWDAALYEINKLLKELDAYIQCRDLNNAHGLAQVISFKVKFETAYEIARAERSEKDRVKIAENVRELSKTTLEKGVNNL